MVINSMKENSNDNFDKLRELKKLLDERIITKEAFDEKEEIIEIDLGERI